MTGYIALVWRRFVYLVKNAAVGMTPGLVWRRFVYLVKNAVVGMIPGLLLVFGLLLVLYLCVFGVGLLLVPAWTRELRGFASMERRRVGAMLGATVPEHYVPLDVDSDGAHVRMVARVRRAVTDRATRRDAAWLVTETVLGPCALVLVVWLWIQALTGLLVPFSQSASPSAAPASAASAYFFLRVDSPGTALLAVLMGLAVAVVATVAILLLAQGHARLARVLLQPSRQARLVERVEELATTRADALHAHGAELRRIERDLHDGAQARLVSLALRLGVAEKKFASDPDAAARLVQEARDGATDALTELREVVRGIYPPILSDRGLAGATEAVAANTAVPITVRAEHTGNLPAAVEAAAYFVITEALTNITRHSGATRANVRLTRQGGSLVVEVRDDGHGGADEAHGSGLAGIRQRIAAFDGHTTVTSPHGGPTLLQVDLPCEL